MDRGRLTLWDLTITGVGTWIEQKNAYYWYLKTRKALRCTQAHNQIIDYSILSGEYGFFEAIYKI